MRVGKDMRDARRQRVDDGDVRDALLVGSQREGFAHARPRHLRGVGEDADKGRRKVRVSQLFHANDELMEIGMQRGLAVASDGDAVHLCPLARVLLEGFTNLCKQDWSPFQPFLRWVGQRPSVLAVDAV